MAALEALLFFLLVPAVVSAIASLFIRSAAEETLRSFPADAFPDRGKGRLPVAIALAAAPLPLGLALWFLGSPVAAAVDAGTFPRRADTDRLLLWATLAFAFAAVGSTISVVICVRSRMAGFLGSDFGRVLPIMVIPFTGVVFALVLNFLLLGYLGDFLPGGSPTAYASVAAIEAAVSAFQAYIVATLAYPVATYMSSRVRDLSRRGFSRAILILEAGELPVLLGLVWGFLAIRGLAAPAS